MLLREIDENYLNEAPMGMLDRLGSKIASYVPGDIGRSAQGKLDTGDTANSLRNDFYKYLGSSGTKPTKSNVLAYIQSQGLPTASAVAPNNVQTLSKSDIDKMFLAAVRESKTAPASTSSSNTSSQSNAQSLSSIQKSANSLSKTDKTNLINYLVKSL